jgi:hypothetical protein
MTYNQKKQYKNHFQYNINRQLSNKMLCCPLKTPINKVKIRFLILINKKHLPKISMLKFSYSIIKKNWNNNVVVSYKYINTGIKWD